jgi:hypothetical protein
VHDGWDRLGMVHEARGDSQQAADCYRKVMLFKSGRELIGLRGLCHFRERLETFFSLQSRCPSKFHEKVAKIPNLQEGFGSASLTRWLVACPIGGWCHPAAPGTDESNVILRLRWEQSYHG